MKTKLLFLLIIIIFSCTRDSDISTNSQIIDIKDSIELKTEGKSINELLMLAKTSRTLLDYYGCIHLMNEVIKRDSVSAEAYYNRGLCYAGLVQLDKSNNDFFKVIKMNYKIENAYLNLGLNYFSKKSFDSASHYFNQVLKINPNNKKAQMLRDLITKTV